MRYTLKVIPWRTLNVQRQLGLSRRQLDDEVNKPSPRVFQEKDGSSLDTETPGIRDRFSGEKSPRNGQAAKKLQIEKMVKTSEKAQPTSVTPLHIADRRYIRPARLQGNLVPTHKKKASTTSVTAINHAASTYNRVFHSTECN